jgi:hypothetical protein
MSTPPQSPSVSCFGLTDPSDRPHSKLYPLMPLAMIGPCLSAISRRPGQSRNWIADDSVSADYEITLFQGAIPELFCCNSIGEGFSAVVVALRWALKNRRGDPLTSEQLYAALNCVVRLNKQLFMKYEAALDLIDDLEKVGLNTDISIAAPLVRLLIEEADEPSAK